MPGSSKGDVHLWFLTGQQQAMTNEIQGLTLKNRRIVFIQTNLGSRDTVRECRNEGLHFVRWRPCSARA
jgi:hypothetical protein